MGRGPLGVSKKPTGSSSLLQGRGAKRAETPAAGMIPRIGSSLMAGLALDNPTQSLWRHRIADDLNGPAPERREGVAQLALRVGDDMALAPFNLLASIEAAGPAAFGRLHRLAVDHAGRRAGFPPSLL